MNWRGLGDVLISGVTIGSVYYLLAAGFTLVYGVGRVLNLAYGSLFTWGAYVAWVFTAGYAGLPLVIGAIVAIPAVFLLGVIIDRGVVAPLRKRQDFDFAVLLATLGLAMVLDNTALVVFGARPKSLPQFGGGGLHLGGFTLSTQAIVILVTALALALGLALFLGRTRTGMSLRAVAQDAIGAQIVGIPLKRVYALTFGLSAALAAVGGILLAPRFFISPLGGWDVFLKALIIAVAGGMGSLRGTLVAAFGLGLLEAFVGWQAGLLWVMPFWFGVLIAILLVRPHGLFGAQGRQA